MKQKKVRGALNVRRRDAKGVVSKAKVLHQCQQQHAQKFTNPLPDATTFGDQVTVTDAAVVAAENGSPSQTAARDVEVGTMHTMMCTRLTYLEAFASGLPPDQAAQAIIDGGADVVGYTPHVKPILAADNAVAPGAVELEANARALLGDNLRRKHLFQWAMTTDGGKTFVNLQPTPKAHTVVNGLTPATTVGFRVAVITWDGVQGPWSPVVELQIK